MDLDGAVVPSGSQNKVFSAVQWAEDHLYLSVLLYKAFSDSISAPTLSESSLSLTLRREINTPHCCLHESGYGSVTSVFYVVAISVSLTNTNGLKLLVPASQK